MVCCYECGEKFASREKEGKLQAYDYDRLVWTDECPNCGRIGFDEEDYFEDEEEYEEEYDY